MTGRNVDDAILTDVRRGDSVFRVGRACRAGPFLWNGRSIVEGPAPPYTKGPARQAGPTEVPMGLLRNLIFAVVPRSWAAAMEAESRRWVTTCPCGAEVSTWDVGGIR